VAFLELFPVRPNLLSRIDNGLGLVTVVTYTTAAEARAVAAADDAGVGAVDDTKPAPIPMIVVDTFDSFPAAPDPADEIHDVVHNRYAGAYYDGVEKQFHGFARVEQL